MEPDAVAAIAEAAEAAEAAQDTAPKADSDGQLQPLRRFSFEVEVIERNGDVLDIDISSSPGLRVGAEDRCAAEIARDNLRTVVENVLAQIQP